MVQTIDSSGIKTYGLETVQILTLIPLKIVEYILLIQHARLENVTTMPALHPAWSVLPQEAIGGSDWVRSGFGLEIKNRNEPRKV